MTSLISKHPCLSPLTIKHYINSVVMYMCDIVEIRLYVVLNVELEIPHKLMFYFTKAQYLTGCREA